MDLTTVLLILGSLTGVLALARLGRGAWRVNRRIVRIADAVTELSPNSGHSIKDRVEQTAKTAERTEKKVDRTDGKVGRTEKKVDALAARFDDHLRNEHGGNQ